jgi:transposase
LTTKIHMACDSLGRPVRFRIAPGQSHDILAASALIEGMAPRAVLADRAYDSGALRQHLSKIGAQAVIPSTRSRKVPIPHDRTLYRMRNRIERCFARLKHFRRFATRYDRLAAHFLSFIHLAAAIIWMR